MSKVISFSISDRYLAKIRSLYPGLTDNLAAKQFLTDRLDEGLSSSLDASLDDGLDCRVKTLVESWVDGLLDERLDATVGKLISSLTERLTRLESRLDESLDGSLDDMEPLLKLQREASIASPIPTGEPSPDEPNAIEPAIDTLPGGDIVTTHDPAIDQKLTNKEIADILGCHSSNLSKWLKTKIIPEKYRDKCEFNHNKTKIVLI
jgi:hypothetical protein